MITINNIVKELMTEELIVQSYAYTKKSSRYWVIMEPLTFQLTGGHIISIPKGFTYDMATVPSFMWSFIKPYDDAIAAYLIHDYLYIFQNKHPLTRAQADKEMLIWANITSRKKLNNYIRYAFVRAFGWLWWKKIV